MTTRVGVRPGTRMRTYTGKKVGEVPTRPSGGHGRGLGAACAPWRRGRAAAGTRCVARGRAWRYGPGCGARRAAQRALMTEQATSAEPAAAVAASATAAERLPPSARRTSVRRKSRIPTGRGRRATPARRRLLMLPLIDPSPARPGGLVHSALQPLYTMAPWQVSGVRRGRPPGAEAAGAARTGRG